MKCWWFVHIPPISKYNSSDLEHCSCCMTLWNASALFTHHLSSIYNSSDLDHCMTLWNASALFTHHLSSIYNISDLEHCMTLWNASALFTHLLYLYVTVVTLNILWVYNLVTHWCSCKSTLRRQVTGWTSNVIWSVALCQQHDCVWDKSEVYFAWGLHSPIITHVFSSCAPLSPQDTQHY